MSDSSESSNQSVEGGEYISVKVVGSCTLDERITKPVRLELKCYFADILKKKKDKPIGTKDNHKVKPSLYGEALTSDELYERLAAAEEEKKRCQVELEKKREERARKRKEKEEKKEEQKKQREEHKKEQEKKKEGEKLSLKLLGANHIANIGHFYNVRQLHLQVTPVKNAT